MCEENFPNCGNLNSPSEVEKKDGKSMYCNETIPTMVSNNTDDRHIERLILTYSKTNETIEISAEGKVTLGRGYTGAEIFDKILNKFNLPVISRKHCSIEFKNGHFFISDERSTNGTFYGDAKAKCTTEPILIANYSLIYFGEELFLAQYQYSTNNSETDSELSHIGNLEQRFICNKCGNESNQADVKCKCGYQNWNEI